MQCLDRPLQVIFAARPLIGLSENRPHRFEANIIPRIARGLFIEDISANEYIVKTDGFRIYAGNLWIMLRNCHKQFNPYFPDSHLIFHVALQYVSLNLNRETLNNPCMSPITPSKTSHYGSLRLEPQTLAQQTPTPNQKPKP